MNKLRTNFRAIAFFSLSATVFSGLFRPGFFDFYATPETNVFVLMGFVVVLIGWGPALAAFLSWKIFGTQNRTSSFLGTWPAGAAMMSAVPMLVFGVIGYPNNLGMNEHLAGALFGLLIFLYALGEEIGWRGYLQDALAPRPVWLRAMIIAPIWFVWHLWFLEANYGIWAMASGALVILGTALILSWVISQTHSWLSAAAFHSVGNMAFLASIIDMPQEQKLKVAGISFVLMLIIHHFWKRRIE